jgi:hypothetical protein
MDPNVLLTPERLTLLGLCLIIIAAFLKGYVHTDGEFKRERERGDKWEALSLQLLMQNHAATAMTRDAVKVAERSLDVVARGNDAHGGGSPP